MRNKHIEGIICALLVFSEKTHGCYSTSGLPKERETAAKESKQRQGTGRENLSEKVQIQLWCCQHVTIQAECILLKI